MIAAGGIGDARGIIAAMALGAEAVQMGTAFLACEGSGASKLHRETLIEKRAGHTALTRGFTGKTGAWSSESADGGVGAHSGGNFAVSVTARDREKYFGGGGRGGESGLGADVGGAECESFWRDGCARRY